MNQKLEKIRDELAKKYSEKDDIDPPPYWNELKEIIYSAGWNAAEPHIRQDERQRIMEFLNTHKIFHDEFQEGYFKSLLNTELKKMDEVKE